MSSVTCTKCDLAVLMEDVVCCNSCKANLHYDCAQVKEIQFRKKSAADKIAWLCTDCRTTRNKNSSPNPKTIDDVFKLVQEVNYTVNSMQIKQNGVEEKLEGVVKSQAFLSEMYEELRKACATIEILHKENQELKAQVIGQNTKIHDLRIRLNSSEQYIRRNQIEVNDVTFQPSENLEQVIINIAEEIGVALKPEDIEVTHRMPSRKKESCPIIVEFNSRKKRNEILNRRYHKVVTNKNILGQGHSDKRIFINESLTPYFKHLLWLTKKYAKENGYKFCWFRKDKIFLKFNEDSNPLAITYEEELEKLQTNKSNNSYK